MTAQVSMFAAPSTRMQVTERPRQIVRPYQELAIEGAREKLADNRSTIVTLPTGTGKTFTACEFIRRHEPGMVLWIAHREELIDQGRIALERLLAESVDVEKAERRASYGSRIVVASVQTLKGDRLEDFAGRFSPALIVEDECHHGVSPSYMAITNRWPSSKILGLTATPDRADEKAIGKKYDSVAFCYDIADAIREGWLCPIRIQRVLVDAIDLRAVKTVAGDLNQGDLDAVMSAEEVLHGVVKPTIELSGNRRTIVFTTSVENAHRMAEIFNRYKAGSARAIDGGTESQERRKILADHKDGAYQYLCNVGVLTEGYDDPGISCIAMARLTKSRSLYAQCAGRGLRILPGKDDCLLLDFVGNSGQHKLASALDILAGRYDDETVERARRKVEHEPGMLADEALAQAAAEILEERKREAARRAAIKGDVKFRTRQIDPFGVLHVSNDNDADARFGIMATEKQIAALQKAGVDIPENLTKRGASDLLGSVFKRRDLGLCTYRQLKTLQKGGVTDINISFHRASRIIDAMAANGWRPLYRDTLDKLLAREAGE